MLLKFLRQPNFYLQTQDNDVFSMKALWGFNKSDYLSSLTLSSAYGMVMITILKSDLQTQDCSYYCGNSLLETRRDFSCSQSWSGIPMVLRNAFFDCLPICYLCYLFSFCRVPCVYVFWCWSLFRCILWKDFLHVGKSALHFVHFYSFCTDIYSLILSYLTFLYVLYFWGVRSLKPFPRIGHMFCFVSSLYLLQWISQTLEFCVCHCHVALVIDAFIIEDVQYFRL